MSSFKNDLNPDGSKDFWHEDVPDLLLLQIATQLTQADFADLSPGDRLSIDTAWTAFVSKAGLRRFTSQKGPDRDIFSCLSKQLNVEDNKAATSALLK